MRVNHSSTSRSTALVALAGLAACAQSAAAQYTIQRIIATGDSAVSAPAPMVDAAAPVIDQYGQLAMLLNVTGGDTRHVVRGHTLMATMLKVGQVSPANPNGVVIEVGGLSNLASDGELAVSFESMTSGINSWRIAVGDPFDWGTAYRSGAYIPERIGQPHPNNASQP